MREILFRGKQFPYLEWVYGYYCCVKEESKTSGNDEWHWMIEENGRNWCVDPKTVGQYTGLTDKNGQKVFEGDIVEHDFGNYHIGKRVAVVEYSQKYCGFQLCPKDNWAYCEMDDCVVIGNVHDNPELLEAK